MRGLGCLATMALKMQANGNFIRMLALLLLSAASLCLPWSSRQESSSLDLTPLLVSLLPAQVFADFDGDSLLDRVELISDGNQKNICLTFSSHWEPSLNFSAKTRLAGSIYSQDIDRDRDSDLIWISDDSPAQIMLWLNNGIGELARVEPGAYDAQIKLRVGSRSENGSTVSADCGWLTAIVNHRFSLLALHDNHHSEALHSGASKSLRHSPASLLSPSVSRYHKRGPPLFPPEFS
jgi:hypothetical protein